MAGMPRPHRLRRRASGGLAAVLLLALAGCAFDGSEPSARAVAAGTEAPADRASGADLEMALEPPDEPGDDALASDATFPTTPTDIAAATLPGSIPSSRMPSSVAVVGDSLTLSAEQEIGAYLTGIGIDEVTIDGAVNRRITRGNDPDPGLEVVEQIADESNPDLWVIALGTNDVGSSVEPDQLEADVETLLDAIPAGAPVVWVDVWIRDRPEQVDAANAVLRRVIGRRAESIVAAWHAHGADPGLVAADGVHLTDDGRSVFAAAIAAATVELFG